LGDLYGSDFAGKVWERYVQAFAIADKATDIVTPETLSIAARCSPPIVG
jgi:hypothetical protein